jgi:hypothetical protein
VQRHGPRLVQDVRRAAAGGEVLEPASAAARAGTHRATTSGTVPPERRQGDRGTQFELERADHAPLPRPADEGGVGTERGTAAEQPRRRVARLCLGHLAAGQPATRLDVRAHRSRSLGGKDSSGVNTFSCATWDHGTTVANHPRAAAAPGVRLPRPGRDPPDAVRGPRATRRGQRAGSAARRRCPRGGSGERPRRRGADGGGTLRPLRRPRAGGLRQRRRDRTAVHHRDPLDPARARARAGRASTRTPPRTRRSPTSCGCPGR